MKSTILISILFLQYYCSSFIYAQTETSKKNWTLDIGYAQYNSTFASSSEVNGEMKVETVNSFRFNVNRITNSHFMPGAYLGYALYPLTGGSGTKKYFSPSYGLNLKYNPMPLFTDAENLRVNVLLQGNLGGIFLTSPKSQFYSGNYMEYGLGLYLSYFLTKRIGIYADYNFGKFHITKLNGLATDNFKLRFGITLRL